MTWEAAVIGMLTLTLLGGFTWYERSRPPSQIVALVAALAAISVAGRVAFSPIPNVVPSTDIVLIAGYTLGGAPGFAVGALTGLVSNFWLGQGPWTPWQMAGWGLTGIIGAGLAFATGRRMGRLSLAAVCALAGFAYGALLDYSVMFSFGGEQSLHRYLAISARGLPFNIAHAAGNAALALVAGPAMVRMLLRYRRRFEFAWKPSPASPRPRGATAGAACLVVALLIAAPAVIGGTRAHASGGGSGAAVSWLRGAQNGDGGFGFGRGEASSPAMTGWAVLGLESAGVNPLDVDRGDATPITYLAGTVGQISTTGDIERTILLLRGAGLNPRRFQGRDLVSRLLARRGGDGSWAGQVNPTAFGILALKAAGATAGNSHSAAWLRGSQNEDGGWGFAAKSASDADSTGAVLQALGATGGGAGTQRGVAYLRGVQRPGGGFALSSGPINAQSTAWAAQGLLAAGISPASVRSGGTPPSYLASVQARDGHYRYSSTSDQTPVWVTGQALMAVNNAAFPLNPVPRAVSNVTGGGGSMSAAGRGASAGSSGGGKTKTTGKSQAAAPTGTQTSTEAQAITVAPASAGDSGDGGGGVPDWLIAAGIIALGVAGVWAGWVMYRRRLPSG
jgi:energy-coupling factor transport system substrate-specific component